MATRTYDVKLTLASAISEDYKGYLLYVPNVSNPAKGIITGVSGNDVYIRYDSGNKFAVGNSVIVTRDQLAGTYKDPKSTPNFTPRPSTQSVTTLASSTISSITQNQFLSEARGKEISELIRFISIKYPGEWYSSDSEFTNNGRAWPHPFPLHFCTQGVSENTTTAEEFPVEFNGIDYLPVPIELDDVPEESDGSIGTFNISIYNINNIVNAIINNPNIAGYSSEGISVTIDGHAQTGIDPRTVPTNAAYNEDIVNYYGKTNAAMDKRQNDLLGGEWTIAKENSKHLLGAVVEITSNFQRFLKYWPEYSTVTNRVTNDTLVNVNDATVYRVGDTVTTKRNNTSAKITQIRFNFELTLDSGIDAQPDDRLYIVNPDADEASSITETFKINKLVGVRGEIATFELQSFLKYFDRTVPRDRIMTDVCRFKYKDARCGYRGPGNYLIKGTANRRANPKAVTLQNQETTDLSKDHCAKNLEACRLRNNDMRFGGFVTVR